MTYFLTTRNRRVYRENEMKTSLRLCHTIIIFLTDNNFNTPKSLRPNLLSTSQNFITFLINRSILYQIYLNNDPATLHYLLPS